jgi:hypothetical protein
MPKLLKTLIHEAKEDMKHLHGTPYLILHTRNDPLYEGKELNQSLSDTLEGYPNQNKHLSGDVSDDHTYHTHKVLSRLYDHYNLGRIDRDEYDAINEHTADSQPLNSSLWERHNEPQWSQGLPENVPTLDRALSRFKVPTGGLTTFHGLQKDPSTFATKHPDNKLFLPSYTSTSISPTETEGFSRAIKPDRDTEVRHFMKFKFPEGMHSGAYIDAISHHQSEMEFLTRRGMSVHLDTEPEVLPFKPQNASKGLLKIWTAHVLGFHEK